MVGATVREPAQGGEQQKQGMLGNSQRERIASIRDEAAPLDEAAQSNCFSRPAGEETAICANRAAG